MKITDRQKILSDDEMSIDYFDPQDFKIVVPAIGAGAFASVYTANWKITRSIFAIKKFNGGLTKDRDVENEIRLMEMVKFHPNIIAFLGVTKFTDERNYSLVLEYANGGTLEEYLRNNTGTFDWKMQLKFVNEITDAIYCLHDKEIIHGDIHPKNILIHQNTIKLADFGCARLQGSDCNISEVTEVWGVTPYVDPKIFERKIPYEINKKCDIYSLGVLFWRLTSRKSPFEFETKNNLALMLDILNGKRENPIPNTNTKFVKLYQMCWEREPDIRPDIHRVVLELNGIDTARNLLSSRFNSVNNDDVLSQKKDGITEYDDFDDFDDCDLSKLDLE